MVVIVDIEGALLHTQECRLAALRETAREQGLRCDEASLRGLTGEAAVERLLRGARRVYTPSERLALQTRQNDLYEERVSALGEDALLPGAKEALTALRSQGIRLGAVMSGGLPGQALSALRIRHCFEAIAREESVAAQLTELMRRMKAEAAECVLVSASGESAKLARALGMRAQGTDGEFWRRLTGRPDAGE